MEDKDKGIMELMKEMKDAIDALRESYNKLHPTKL